VSVETVFVGGSIFTAGMASSAPGAVAVTGGRITALGSDEEILDLRGPGTEIVEVKGGLVIPGFQDAHVHPAMGGVDLLRCSVFHCDSAEEDLEVIGAYAAAHPELEWIIGSGWNMAHFPGGTPTRQMLDSVLPDRPAFLPNKDGHGAWVNTAALRAAGITEETPDPSDGRIEREPDGYPSGTLHEGAADLVGRLLPKTSPEETLRGLLLAQEQLLALGITGWQDAAVGDVFEQGDLLETYLSIAARGALAARVVGALWWDRDRSSDQIPDLVQRRADGGAGRFVPSAVKIMLDGVAENYTAAMLEPYLDGCGCHTDNSGLDFVDPEGLKEYVTELDRLGFQVHFHALGDRAVRHALDAIEAARDANGPQGGRHHLAHLQVVHPDDIGRFAALGATANMQPLWACNEPQMTELTIPYLGERRARWQYPWADLLSAGATMAAGSDWSVSSPNPLEGIHVAVNRRAPGDDEAEVFLPEQRISLADAVSAYTAGSARVNGREADTGALTAGYLADLAVIDRDIFTRPVDEIARASVTATYIEGECVYRASEARGDDRGMP
jgi:predicted amidohydrolase YtcJ